MISIIGGRNDISNHSINPNQTRLIQRFHEDLIIDRIVSFIDAIYSDDPNQFFSELRKSIIVGIYLVGTTRDEINPEYTIYVAYDTNRIPFDKDIDNNSKYVLKNLAEAQLNSFVAEQTFKYLKDTELSISFKKVDFEDEIADLEAEKTGLKDSFQTAKSKNHRRHIKPESVTYNYVAETKIANLVNGQIIHEENKLLSSLLEQQTNMPNMNKSSHYLPREIVQRISIEVSKLTADFPIRIKKK